jgi:protein SCO1/2
MRDYLKRYNAKPGWDFLTGNTGDIRKVLAAFDVNSTADKMYHLPLALLHSQKNQKWVRIYGLIGTSDLMAEYKEMLGR